ncbi:hypothetical protein RND81_11G108800 [Saponaria officinalis]|uniref:Uncharacterized protein n=1 Tax=Saponaria officinalis TaxID=3572 RepID=A0AAW1HKH8_SAPOF
MATLSNEIASLSVSMQKLNAVVSNLVLARSLQGTFDMSKLPRNCLTALKLDHLVPVEQQVLNEIPAPNPPMSANDLCQNKDGAPISDTHHVFDKMSVPDLILDMAQAAKIAQTSAAIIYDEDRRNDVNELQASIEVDVVKENVGNINMYEKLLPRLNLRNETGLFSKYYARQWLLVVYHSSDQTPRHNDELHDLNLRFGYSNLQVYTSVGYDRVLASVSIYGPGNIGDDRVVATPKHIPNTLYYNMSTWLQSLSVTYAPDSFSILVGHV